MRRGSKCPSMFRALLTGQQADLDSANNPSTGFETAPPLSLLEALRLKFERNASPPEEERVGRLYRD